LTGFRPVLSSKFKETLESVCSFSKDSRVLKPFHVL
jgi:hypothetical protein